MTTNKPEYENNPFYIGLNGIKMFFNKAQGVAFLLIAFSILSTFSGNTNIENEGKSQFPSWPWEQWLMLGGVITIILLAALFIMTMISGISAYTSAKLLKGKSVSIREAFNAVMDRFFSFLWLQILTSIKVLLWTLLLIIPGLVMAYRYSLANIAFFDQGLKGNDAIKESLRLTKGAFLTTFAAQLLFDVITFGMLSELVSGGARTVLYQQFKALGDKEKPSAHGLTWFAAFLPIAFVVAVIVLLGAGMIALRSVQ